MIPIPPGVSGEEPPATHSRQLRRPGGGEPQDGDEAAEEDRLTAAPRAEALAGGRRAAYAHHDHGMHRESRPQPLPNTSTARPGEHFLTHPIHALSAACGMLALVTLMAILVPTQPLALDHSWSELMDDIQTPLLTDLANIFNWLGRAPGRAIALTIIGLLLVRGRRWLAVIAFAIAESVASLCSGLLKSLVARPRPPDGLIHPLGNSFPSGHATYAAATCVAIVLLFTTPGPRRRPWWTLATLVIIGMAWSRTYLQVHWLTDVIAGALLGSGVSLLTFAITQVRERPDPSASIEASLHRDPLPEPKRSH